MPNTTLEAVRLEPCPFCGAPGKYECERKYESWSASDAIASGMGYSAGGITRESHYVHCTREWACYARVSGGSEADAIAAWNRRAAPAVAGGWRPIESAPAREAVMVAYQRDNRWIVGEAMLHENDEWRWANNDPTDAWGCAIYPKFWQPLPPPPGTAS